jgi:hypothetical protein
MSVHVARSFFTALDLVGPLAPFENVVFLISFVKLQFLDFFVFRSPKMMILPRTLPFSARIGLDAQKVYN